MEALRRDLHTIREEMTGIRGGLRGFSEWSVQTERKITELQVRCDSALQRIHAAEADAQPVEPPATEAMTVAAAAQTPSREETRPPATETVKAGRSEEPRPVQATPRAMAETRAPEPSPEAVRRSVAPSPPPQARPARPSRPAHARPERDLEGAIGSYWLSRLGALSLLVGFIILASLVNTRVGPGVRLTFCYLGAAALCSVGALTHKRHPKYAQPILATGLILAFFASFAAHFVPGLNCLPLGASLLLMTLSTAAVVAVTFLTRSEALGLLAMGFGFWTAVFTAQLAPSLTPAMLVFLALFGGASLMAFNWRKLSLVSVIGVFACQFGWRLTAAEALTGDLFATHFGYLTAFFAIFAAADWLDRWRRQAKPNGNTWVRTPAALLNPIVYLLLGALCFHTSGYWTQVHWFVFPMAAACAGFGYLSRRWKSHVTSESDVYTILSAGLAGLGLSSAFDTLSLSALLALESVVLYALAIRSRRGLFNLLSLALGAWAFVQFNTDVLGARILAEANDWPLFFTGLPVILLFLTPAVLSTWLQRRTATPDQSAGVTGSASWLLWLRGDCVWSHLRTLAASGLLLRLMAASLLPPEIFGLLALLAAGLLALCQYWRAVPALLTAMCCAFAGGEILFVAVWRAIDAGQPQWLVPAAAGFTLAISVFAALAEQARRTASGPTPRDLWTLAVTLASLVSIVNVFLLVHLKMSPALAFPAIAAAGLLLLLPARDLELRGPVLTGWLMVFLGAGYEVLLLSNHRGDDSANLFAGALLGGAILVAFERLLRARHAEVLADSRFRCLGGILVAMLAILLISLVHLTPWIAGQYETVGLTVAAVTLFALGLAFRSTNYRRAGLLFLILAIARVYLVDLASLPKVHKTVAFLVLGTALIAVGWIYTRYHERFRRWMS